MILKQNDVKCRLDIVSSWLLLFCLVVSLDDPLAILRLSCPASAISHVSELVAISDSVVILVVQSGRDSRDDRLIIIAELIVFREVRRRRCKIRLIVSHVIGILLIIILLLIIRHLRISMVRDGAIQRTLKLEEIKVTPSNTIWPIVRLLLAADFHRCSPDDLKRRHDAMSTKVNP